LYEKNRVLHRRGLDQLEMEMMSFSREWDRAVDGSPNRLDAMTWVLTRLSKITRRFRLHSTINFKRTIKIGERIR
jgi:phage terminase large subunit-like protein